MLHVIMAFGLLVFVYILFENKYDFKKATFMKAVCSVFFSAVAAAAMFLSGFAITSVLVFCAMFFAIFGDYYLQYIKKDMEKFKKGVTFFSVTQVFLIIMFLLQIGFKWYTAIIFIGLLVIALVLMKVQKWDMGQAAKNLTVYTLLIAFMTSLALSGLISGGAVFGESLMCFGAVLFFVSDMILGIWSYKYQKIFAADLNWIFYFAGQILISAGSFYLWS